MCSQLPLCRSSLETGACFPPVCPILTSDPWEQQGIFIHTAAARWVFFFRSDASTVAAGVSSFFHFVTAVAQYQSTLSSFLTTLSRDLHNLPLLLCSSSSTLIGSVCRPSILHPRLALLLQCPDCCGTWCSCSRAVFHLISAATKHTAIHSVSGTCLAVTTGSFVCRSPSSW